jgi:hypothetical protein
MDKVFIIGLNKTGTTTLEWALKTLGYNVKPYSDLEVIRLHKAKNKTKIIKNMTKNYNAFQDLPWCSYWENVYNIYPNAKYILTERTDVNKWLKSLINHTLRVTASKHNSYDALKTNKLTYGYRYPGFHKNEFKKFYRKHNTSIKRFFSDKDNLLVFNLKHVTNKWGYLCNFLDKEIPEYSFPYANKGNYYYYDRIKKIAETHPEKFFGFKKEEL